MTRTQAVNSADNKAIIWSKLPMKIKLWVENEATKCPYGDLPNEAKIPFATKVISVYRQFLCTWLLGIGITCQSRYINLLGLIDVLLDVWQSQRHLMKLLFHMLHHAFSSSNFGASKIIAIY